MMLVVTREMNLFGYVITRARRDGVDIAIKYEGEPWRIYPMHTEEVELTRAQGFKYWGKYFPLRADYTLPLALQEAIAREPRTEVLKNNILYCG